ncbi:MULTISPECIES: hypothetical protein [Bradyrhizobium]|jgi:hypothetical protein|uniref:Uncharacterized protein n=1 Tax=Bradyrhizobium elkanii TaxID=29448 RepID=A0A8I1YNQ4_BRAEL|nr:hypothetical protein [Bradyrhizobium elkanii]MBP1299538.1 hypothetical protein [Bradyrhizobium elkanii]MCS3565813.1 hypothetical protein [Bradyrhizobium elkanii]MCS3883780.1 hypothetical protein [Bradyrhizobium elkanii]MCW2108092.1 hypothetical protein [Bradyrhizobium elkanii]MCW2153456.1 hypothetical protein [Bradyrhizobium elkanii]
MQPQATVELAVRDFLIRGCLKVIGHYERLLSTARSEQGGSSIKPGLSESSE